MEATIPTESKAGKYRAPRPAPAQIVIREFPDIGKYKVRLLQKSTRDARLILDIREYADSPTFKGFTRRGVRFMVDEELAKLRDVLEKIGRA
jgi:hypothetical protein